MLTRSTYSVEFKNSNIFKSIKFQKSLFQTQLFMEDFPAPKTLKQQQKHRITFLIS